MFGKVSFTSALLAALALSTEGRFLIIERDGRAIFPRRFGQEQGNGIPAQIGQACRGEVCGVLGGEAIGKLLAGNEVCGQQDHADKIIDAARQETDPAVTAKMIELAIQFRQLEKNTPPDFTKNPPALRNSLFCQKRPKNSELLGLVQAQDPANDPNLFFDPETKSTVLLGELGTTPPVFDSASPNPDPAQENPASTEAPAATPTAAPVETPAATETCPALQTVTVTVTAGDAAATPTAAPTEAPAAPSPAPSGGQASAAPDLSGALDFGSCTDPSIEFGPAFEGRALREFTFKPVNKQEFPQGSALNGNIVTNAVCNILKNTCKAPDATNAACEAGKAAFAAATKGAAADAFNAALGITTTFATIPAAPGGGPGSVELATKANFNKCAAPTIVFQVGNDGRKDATFVPVNRDDFPQAPALNPAIVPRAVCDTLMNRCDANIVAINDCEAAITAIQGLSGQAVVDAFNAAVLKNA